MRSGARQALSFLTPFAGAATPSPAAVAWFPAVGASLGAALGVAWSLADHLWAAGLTAAIVVAADLAATGLLHLDGLVDTADGLLPHLDTGRRLEVMARPDTGAFGVGVAVAVLLLRWGALASLAPSPLLLGGLWCASRTTMAIAVQRLPYARPGNGLATSFIATGSRPGGPAARRIPMVGGYGLALSLALALAWNPLPGAVAVAAASLAGGAVLALARRRIGGFTGDVLGAAGLVAETTGLVVAAARW